MADHVEQQPSTPIFGDEDATGQADDQGSKARFQSCAG